MILDYWQLLCGKTTGEVGEGFPPEKLPELVEILLARAIKAESRLAAQREAQQQMLSGVVRKAPGYMVWNPKANMPRHIHGDLVAASKEATRLAQAHPGNTFYAMAPVTFAEINVRMVPRHDPIQCGSIQQITSSELDDEIPF